MQSKSSTKLRLTAEDIHDPNLADDLIDLWKYDRYNKHMKTNPCRDGKQCRRSPCNFSHYSLHDVPLVRCLHCSRPGTTCHGLELKEVNCALNFIDNNVYAVCWGMVDILIHNRSFIGKPLPRVPEQPIQIKKADPVVENLEAALTTKQSQEGEVPSKKRERPAEPNYYLTCDSKTRKALTNMVADPAFRGIVKIAQSHLLEMLDHMSPVDIMALYPQIEKLPLSKRVVGYVKMAMENADMKAQLASLTKPI